MIGRREVRFQRLRRHVVPVSRKGITFTDSHCSCNSYVLLYAVWLLKLAEKKKKRQRESARGSEQDSIIDRNHAKLCGNEDSAPCDIDHRYSADSDDQVVHT